MKAEQIKGLFTTPALVGALMLGVTAGWAGTAQAQDQAQAENDGPFSLSGNVTLASEYIFRGVSLSDEDPALQGSLLVSHESGFYAGVWGSSGEFNGGAGNLELDYMVGYSRDMSGIVFDLSLIYYTYPGDERKGDYFEVVGKASYDFGLVAITGGAGYVPSGQRAYGNEDALYLFGDVQVPVPTLPVTAVFHLGYEDFGRGSNKLDWSAGLAANFYGLDMSIAYVDTDLKDVDVADSRVLLTIGKSF